MEYLFETGDLSATLKRQNETIKNKISELSNEQICNTDIGDLEEYYFEKYQIESIMLFLENASSVLTETKIEEYNHFYDRSGFEPKYYSIDGYKVTFEIQFDGDTNLLYLRPNTFYMSKFPVDKLINSTKDNYGKIIYSLKFKKSELENKDNEFIQNEFNKKFKTYLETINNINAEVEIYNNNLKNFIYSCLQTRLKKATDYIKMSEKLNIPLVQNPNAPNTKPILLKKVKRNKQLNFPNQKQKEIEYCISDYDYSNIKNIIDLACVSMEKSARTFYKFQEEELRDIILSNLNTHYQGNATGETFNKRGKTDIHISFENKSAYIGECKIWHGIKKFYEAIGQLFSYMTWRDTKTSLIIFNKDTKDFKKILETVNKYLNENELCEKIVRVKQNEWQCAFKKYADSEERIDINICMYDLCIDE